MVEVLLIALALSMDAFAISIALGARKITKSAAIKVVLVFGFLQALMPLIGYQIGFLLSKISWFSEVSHIIAAVLLFGIGAKMLYDVYKDEENNIDPNLSNYILILLGIATSIDALAAGLSLVHLSVNYLVGVLVIGTVTVIMCSIGINIGKKSGVWLEEKSVILGAIILMLMGIKMIVFN